MWGRLSGQQFPGQLPAAAVKLLQGMECDLIDEEDIEPEWLTTLVDSPNDGLVRGEIESLAARLVKD
jgi:acetoin utilization protein AcuC